MTCIRGRSAGGMIDRESKLADRQSAAPVAAKASATDIGANLSVLSPDSELPFNAAGPAGWTVVFATGETARVAEPGCPDKSLPASDDGISRGGCGVGRASRIRNRSSRMSMTTNSAASNERKNVGEATSNFDLRTRGVHQGQLNQWAGRKPCACFGRTAHWVSWPNEQRLWGRVGKNNQPRRNAAARWS